MSYADERILAAAKSWLGTPYRKAGIDRRRGVDCLNFVGFSFLQAGVITALPEHRDYEYGFWRKPGDPIVDAIEEAIGHLSPGHDVIRILSPDDAAWFPGDLLCLSQLRRMDKVTHTALVESVQTWGTTILHSRQGRGGRVERTQLDSSWRVSRIYRITGWDAQDRS